MIRNPCPRVLVATAIACILVGIGVRAADPPKDDEDTRQRNEFLTRKAGEFVLSTAKDPDKPLTREKEPVLRFTNPVRSSNMHGAIYVWLSGDRPAAIAALRIRPDGAVWREFTSLSDQALLCKRDGQTLWSPGADGMLKKPLNEAPEPAATPALRLAQMRRQAERFSADFDHLSAGKWEALRLLPQPIYRYTTDKGATEGAIFALVQTNDPEALLILELSRPTDAKATWNYALVRASSQPMRANLGDKEVWSVKGYWSNPRSKDDAYQESADGKYPAPEPAPKKE